MILFDAASFIGTRNKASLGCFIFSITQDSRMLIRSPRLSVSFAYSHHWLKKHPYLVEDITLKGADYVWVLDTTYLKLQDRYCYLSLTTEAIHGKYLVMHCTYR